MSKILPMSCAWDRTGRRTPRTTYNHGSSNGNVLSGRRGARGSERLAHWNRVDADASGQSVAASPSRNVPALSVEPLSGQCRDELGDNKSRGPGLTFAQGEEPTAQASPGPIRMNEERSDPRRLASRVEQS